MKFEVPINAVNLDEATRDAYTAIEGDVIYNTDQDRYQFYDGVEWKQFGTVAGGAEVAFDRVVTFTGIDGTTVADHNIYTVPTGKQFTTGFLICRVQTIVGGSGAAMFPNIEMGVGVGTDDIIINTKVTGLDATNKSYVFSISGLIRTAESTESIYLRIDSTSNSTTYDIDVDLIGALV